MISLALTGALLVAPADPETDPITILDRGRETVARGAVVEEGRLWLPLDSLPQLVGFEWKPEGLCAGELCIPVPEDAGWVRERGEVRQVDWTAFAAHVDQPVVIGPEGRSFSLGPVPAVRAAGLGAGLAPDFALADRQGRTVRLTDFRGKKVLLLTWASW